MTIRLACQSCRRKLKLPDSAAGRKAECPECGSVFRVSAAGAASTPQPRMQPAPREQVIAKHDRDVKPLAPRSGSKLNKRQEEPVAEIASEANIEIDEDVEVPRPSVSRGGIREDESVVQIASDPVIELDVAEGPPTPPIRKPATSMSAPRPKKKKKKKKRAKSRDPVDVPGWAWWVAGVGGSVALCLIAALVAVATGHSAELFGYGILLGVMIPVSTIILVISMVISSALSGGIDFGEVHTAIAKALLLIFAVNVVGLVPFGGILALPIWLFGLMYLYNLDFWETRFLVFINWVLNYAAKFALAAMVLAALHHGSSGLDVDDHPIIGPSGGNHGADIEMSNPADED